MFLTRQSSPKTTTLPLWILRTPEIRASIVDLPTPSGPITPTMFRRNVDRHIVERDRRTVAVRDALEPGDRSRSLRQLDLQIVGPWRRRIGAYDADSAHSCLHPAAVLLEDLRVQFSLRGTSAFRVPRWSRRSSA